MLWRKIISRSKAKHESLKEGHANGVRSSIYWLRERYYKETDIDKKRYLGLLIQDIASELGETYYLN